MLYLARFNSMQRVMQLERSSGLLLHITSLPGRFGIGDLGQEAYRFVDACAAAGQRIWQVLPVGPVALGYSPYASPSAFAGNPLLISPELLQRGGYLTDSDLQDVPWFPEGWVDYEYVTNCKTALLEKAFGRFERSGQPDAYKTFCRSQSWWLDDYALFAALKDAANGAAWTAWPAGVRGRKADALDSAARACRRGILKHRFWQFLFHEQWHALRAYGNGRGVLLMGDAPIYVAHDSADVWAAPHLYHLGKDGEPRLVAGVPPDFFSETGQRWGNPLYRWDIMQAEGYAWWIARLRRALNLFDALRLDHFRGFAGYWEVPAEAPTAATGRWAPGPGSSLFLEAEARLGRLPILAENLGIITDDVTALMNQFGYPGMAVLQFGFGYDLQNEHLPHNYAPHLVAYTGTHDNNTLEGWWSSPRLPESERRFAREYLQDFGDVDSDVCGCALRALMSSRAGWVITPVQDVLGLSAAARMNVPGTVQGNWCWRLRTEELDALADAAGARLAVLMREHARTGAPPEGTGSAISPPAKQAPERPLRA